MVPAGWGYQTVTVVYRNQLVRQVPLDTLAELVPFTLIIASDGPCQEIFLIFPMFSCKTLINKPIAVCMVANFESVASLAEVK